MSTAKKSRGLEFDWIAQLLKSDACQQVVKGASGVIGAGDDCALLPVGDRNLLLTCDSSVVGRHFQLEPPVWHAVGWRLACASISDLLACGGTALVALVSVLTPTKILNQPANQVIEAVYEGLSQAAKFYRFQVVGGNYSQAETLAFDCFMLGETKRFIARTGVQAGDWLALSGALGEAEAGRKILAGRGTTQAPLHEQFLMQKWLRPSIPVQLAPWLHEHAKAAIDISDGLSSELHHLAEASQVQLQIQSDLLSAPVQLQTWLASKGHDQLQWLLHSGECWQLLVAGAPETRQSAEAAGLFVIGQASAGKGVYLDQQPLLPKGWTHF